MICKIYYDLATGRIMGGNKSSSSDIFTSNATLPEIDITKYPNREDIWNNQQQYKIISGVIIKKTDQEIAQIGIKTPPVLPSVALLARINALETKVAALERKVK